MWEASISFFRGNTGCPDAGLAGPGILSGQLVAGLDEAHNFFIGQSIIQDYRNPYDKQDKYLEQHAKRPPLQGGFLY